MPLRVIGAKAGRSVLVLCLLGLHAVAAGPAIAAPGKPELTVLPDVPVTATNLSEQLSQNSPALAVDPTESRFVALASRVDGPSTFDCALHVSGDAGRSWRPARPVPELPPGAEHCYAPEIAFDGDGRLYYLFVGLSGSSNAPMGAFLTSSVDRGATFAKPVRVLGPRSYAVRMAIDPDIGERGRLHLAWLSATSEPLLGGLPSSVNPILTAFSDDGGQTFTDPVQVSDPSRALVVAPALALGPDHAVHVAYYDLGDDRRDYQGLEGPAWEGSWSLVAVSSSDGGRHFGTGTVVNADIAPPERVMLIFTMPPPALVAGSSGNLYVSWWDIRHGDWDVFVARSVDSGRSWETPIRVNDDSLGHGKHQYMPRLSVAPNGRLDVIFYDRRDDDQNALNHVYYSYSEDHGRRFEASQRLSSRSFSSRTGSRYPILSARGLVEFGSRIALASSDASVLAAWTDTRFVGVGQEHQDVFATQINVAGSGAGSGLLGVAAPIGLGAAFVAGGIAVWRRRRRVPGSASVSED